eukprot:351532-Chlamydomonas_euryale.AAC.1
MTGMVICHECGSQHHAQVGNYAQQTASERAHDAGTGSATTSSEGSVGSHTYTRKPPERSPTATPGSAAVAPARRTLQCASPQRAAFHPPFPPAWGVLNCSPAPAVAHSPQHVHPNMRPCGWCTCTWWWTLHTMSGGGHSIP